MTAPNSQLVSVTVTPRNCLRFKSNTITQEQFDKMQLAEQILHAAASDVDVQIVGVGNDTRSLRATPRTSAPVFYPHDQKEMQDCTDIHRMLDESWGKQELMLIATSKPKSEDGKDEDASNLPTIEKMNLYYDGEVPTAKLGLTDEEKAKAEAGVAEVWKRLGEAWVGSDAAKGVDEMYEQMKRERDARLASVHKSTTLSPFAQYLMTRDHTDAVINAHKFPSRLTEQEVTVRPFDGVETATKSAEAGYMSRKLEHKMETGPVPDFDGDEMNVHTSANFTNSEFCFDMMPQRLTEQEVTRTAEEEEEDAAEWERVEDKPKEEEEVAENSEELPALEEEVEAPLEEKYKHFIIPNTVVYVPHDTARAFHTSTNFMTSRIDPKTLPDSSSLRDLRVGALDHAKEVIKKLEELESGYRARLDGIAMKKRSLLTIVEEMEKEV